VFLRIDLVSRHEEDHSPSYKEKTTHSLIRKRDLYVNMKVHLIARHEEDAAQLGDHGIEELDAAPKQRATIVALPTCKTCKHIGHSGLGGDGL